jgi:hypothetical protein
MDEPKRAKVEFDGEGMNKQFALVPLGSRVVIFWERPHARVEERKKFLSIEAFDAYHSNIFCERRLADGKVKVVAIGRAWRQWSGRRTYEGVEFFPDPHNMPGTPGYYNLWGGFAVEPSDTVDPSRYSVFRDHLLNNVCSGREDLFLWLFAYFAHMIQKPRERPGVALVLRGPMGCGKTKVGEVIGRLIENNYFLVDDPRYVTGNFNAHMAHCLMLQADEAVWAGDKKAEGRLRGLVTSSVQQIENKGMDPIRLPNYVRLMLTSNEDWVVPAGKDERRFCVLDVHGRCAQNREYFAELDAELAAGGLNFLLRDLLLFDLNSVDLGRIPKTLALLDQKTKSLNSLDSWWYDRLMMGAPTHRHDGWTDHVVCELLYSDYIVASEKQGIKRKVSAISFGKDLFKLVPGLDRQKRAVPEHGGPDGLTVITKRRWCYVIPDLETCRAGWDELMQQPTEWPVDEDAPPEAPPAATGL